MQIQLNKKTKKILVIALSAILGLGVIVGGIVAAFSGKGKAPDFKILNERGQSVQLSDYQGKPVVVNFWATWCGPCQSEMPGFENAYDEYKKDVQFMMVNLTTWEKTNSVSYVKDFLLDKGYDFPVFFDTKGEAADKYNVQSIPLTLFIDENGKLLYKHSGAMSETQLNHYIEKYLL